MKQQQHEYAQYNKFTEEKKIIQIVCVAFRFSMWHKCHFEAHRNQPLIAFMIATKKKKTKKNKSTRDHTQYKLLLVFDSILQCYFKCSTDLTIKNLNIISVYEKFDQEPKHFNKKNFWFNFGQHFRVARVPIPNCKTTISKRRRLIFIL